MENFSAESIPTKKPWYKTTGGGIFLGIIGIIVLATILFSGLTGYYAWQIKAGKAGDLTQEFRPEFSTAAAINPREQPRITVDNPDQYVRPHNPTYGNKNAPIRIIMFIDFECPYCQKSYPILKSVTERYGDAVSLVFKHFPLTSIHPNAEQAALAASCADDQGAFWKYHDILFTKKQLDKAALLSYADEINLDATVFAACLSAASHQANIDQDLADGIATGTRGTPTYIVNQIKVEGVIDEATWDELLIDQLQRAL
jgi:protein-disulfide isomerase